MVYFLLDSDWYLMHLIALVPVGCSVAELAATRPDAIDSHPRPFLRSYYSKRLLTVAKKTV